MRPRSGSRRWTTILAAGLALRPILIVPMAQGGPLGGSDLLPIGLLTVLAGSLLLAAGVLARIRPVTAFAILTAAAGVGLAVIGAWAGLPSPWPLLLAAYNAALVGVGIGAWREQQPAASG
ncbi:MAG: hypothetical protein MUE82_00385 [Chloroflexi bacterium]|jgi:hypothetical protein|nr:hypothetical protein [Chloroflexota bacterium]